MSSPIRPLQSVHQLATAPERSTVAPVGSIVCQDNIEVLGSLADGCCDLIYADPPFMTEQIMGPAHNAAYRFDDRGNGGLTGHLDFLRPRVREMFRLLSPRGCLYLHLDWRTVHYVKVMLDEIFGARRFLNEIIWSYRSGGRPAEWFPRKHDTLLLYAKQPGLHTFNRIRSGAYRTRDLRVTDDGRPYKSTTNGPVYFHPDGPAVSDVWDIPFLSTVSKERTCYPTQKPEALLERVIQASSNRGDVVADFFCGSGTTLAVAKRLGRRWIGCDDNPDAVRITRERLAAINESE